MKRKSNTKTMAPLLRIVFFLVMLLLAISSLFFTFRGLSTRQGMEQAQIGRQIAQGHGYATKSITPIAIWQMREKDGNTPLFSHFQETYHAPLNPLIYAGVLKLSGKDDPDACKMSKKDNIYAPDRLIAGVGVLFFLLSIGVNYLLISRIFDTTIAAVVSILMLFSDLMWRFSLSGLPQMVMLFFFSCALFLLWQAMENAEKNRPYLLPIFLAGVLLTLMVLANWVALWLFLGFVIFCAIAFKPRGVIAVGLLLILLVVITPVLALLYYQPTGSFLGTAYYAIHNGLGASELRILSSLNPGEADLGLRGLLVNIFSTTLRQVKDLHANLGAILVAPLFFLALLHPFKRQSLSRFRWLLLLMWVFQAVGMTIYGLESDAMSSNQMHILFAPVMAAYGLALVAVLWSRLHIPSRLPVFRYAHFIVIVLISSGPMLLVTPQNISHGLMYSSIGGYPLWPPYYPKAYNDSLDKLTTKQDIILTDAPWAVAWYADRTAILLPRDLTQIQAIESMAEEQNTPISGIMITPCSFNEAPLLNVQKSYKRLFPLVFGAWANLGGAENFMMTSPDFKPLMQRYQYVRLLFSEGFITYYSSRPLKKMIGETL